MDARYNEQHQFHDDEPSVFEPMLADIVSGFIHLDDTAPGTYAPQLISNRHGTTMGDELRTELREGSKFAISVAFVSEQALKGLYQSFLESSGGTLITSTKSDFNSPAAFRELRKLQQYAHVDVRVWEGDFHPKGYVFTHSHISNLYVGSSNLTCSALGHQREWNLRVPVADGSGLLDQVRAELDEQIQESVELTDEWIANYAKHYEQVSQTIPSTPTKPSQIVPNTMQQEALTNLTRLRARGARKAIIVSATGTGKTILSALDVRATSPKRMLYVANRTEILKAARQSYIRVLGGSPDDFGLLTGESKCMDTRYVFASVDTLCSNGSRVLHEFDPQEFDYVLIDEVHHAGASRYREVINWFDGARFMLGMTATPERTDGINIFELFDYNVAYEIRLQQALDAGMLCPFHYYGITEYLGANDSRIVVGMNECVKDNQLAYEIAQLASEDRVRYMIDMLQQYGSYDTPVKGLVFCSRTAEAEALSELFNQQINQQDERLYRTMAVSGKTPQSVRNDAITALEKGELDYLFTVDLFNEGIDIPSVNQLVMLRNTESSIVFTQQLGRGLRKANGKTCVTVIDFIGNYANNWLIPVALYGNGGDRDTVRKNLQRESIGLSSVSFDRIARERVLNSLDRAQWSDMRRLGAQYANLRYELGRIPMLRDIHMHDPSLVLTIANAKRASSSKKAPKENRYGGNYYAFVRAMEHKMGRMKDYREISSLIDTLTPIDEYENQILKMATEILLPGLRPQELVIIDELLKGGTRSFTELKYALATRFSQAYLTDAQFESAIHVLDYSYFDSPTRGRYGDLPLIEVHGESISLTNQFRMRLEKNASFRMFFNDCVETGLLMCTDLLHEWELTGRSQNSERGFVYGHKYKVAEVERLLGWRTQVNAQNVGGYKRDEDTGTMPIFIKYAASQYADKFLNNQEMLWYSKNGRTPQSPEFMWLKPKDSFSSSNGVLDTAWSITHFVPLFVMRQEESDESQYYYVGHVSKLSIPKLIEREEYNKTDGVIKTVKVTQTDLRLNEAIDEELYRHLTGKSA